MPRTIIKYSFYLLFFATPLLFFPWTFELFEFNKMMFVYLMTIIIATAWLAEMLTTRPVLVKRTPLDFPILLFLASQIISTYFSIHPHTSLIGYYSRFHGGLLSTLSYVLLYYAFITFMQPDPAPRITNHESRIKPSPNSLFVIPNSHVRTCLNLLLTSATLVAAYGVAEHFGIDKHLWVQDVQRRVFSTLGQPNWLAAFLIMVIPLTWAMSITSTSQLFLILNSSFFITLLYTKSRSGILAFAISYAVFWLLTSFSVILSRVRLDEGSRRFLGPKPQNNNPPSFPWRKFFILNSLFFILSVSDGLSWLSPVNRLSDYLSIRLSGQPTTDNRSPRDEALRGQPTTDKPIVGTQLESGGTESGKIRQIVWKGALEIWKHYPYFGSGVETFAYAYYNFRPVEHNLVSEWDFLYNKAHNEYLNLLATTGAFGLGSYLFLQTSIFLWLLKQILIPSGEVSQFARLLGQANGMASFSKSRHNQKIPLQANKLLLTDLSWTQPNHHPILIAIFSALAGVSVSNFFGFSTVEIGLLMFLFPAIAVVLVHKPITEKPTTDNRSPCDEVLRGQLTNRFLFIPLLLATGYLLLALARWYYADTQFASGKRYGEAGYLAEAFPCLETATRLLPFEPTYHNEFSSVAAEVAVAFSQKNATDSAEQALTLALKESETTRTQNPVHVNFVKTRARVMLTLTEINPIFLKEAENALSYGLELSPTDAKIMYNLALLQKQQNQPQKSLETLQKTVAIKPNYEAARLTLGMMYEDLAASTSGAPKQTYLNQAAEQYRYILEKISPKNPTVKQKLDQLQINIP